MIITITDNGLDAALSKLSAKLTNLQPMYADMGEYLVRKIDDEFKFEREPNGKPWAPLANSTLKRKVRHKRILKIWQESGSTRATLAYKATGAGAAVGVNTKYAPYVNSGTKRMKARPLIPEVLPPEVLAGLEAIALDYLES